MAASKEDLETLVVKLAACRIDISDPTAEEDVKKLISRLQDLTDLNSTLFALRFLFDEKAVEYWLPELKERAKDAFIKIMLIKSEDNNRDGRMPNKHQLEVLKDIDPALCKTLRDGTVRNFYNILYPDPEEELRGTVFCLKGTEEDRTIFGDMVKRAKLLAKEILVHKEENGDKVKCYFMDGFGRVFLCLIKALIEEGLDPDDDVEFIVCEIDDHVHDYHKYVFPSKVTKLKQNVMQEYGDYVEAKSVVYLNFCSVPSSHDAKAWKMSLRPRCVKENVLKLISSLTRPPKSCSVMVSLVILDGKTKGEEKLFPPVKNNAPEGDKYITGLGFLKVIRDREFFNSEDDDIILRPEETIKWNDEARRLPSEDGLCGKQVHVFASVMVHPKQPTKNLIDWFKDMHILDVIDNNDEISKGDMVEIVSKKDYGKHGLVISRTPKGARVVLLNDDNLPLLKYLRSLRKLPENDQNVREKEQIRRRLDF